MQPKIIELLGRPHGTTMCKVLSCKVGQVQALQGYQNALEMLHTKDKVRVSVVKQKCYEAI